MQNNDELFEAECHYNTVEDMKKLAPVALSLSIISVAGNILIILGNARGNEKTKKRKITVHSATKISLALADLIYAISMLFLSVIVMIRSELAWRVPPLLLSTLYHMIIPLVISISYYHLCLMSYRRHLSIGGVPNARTRWINKPWVLKLIWLLCFVVYMGSYTTVVDECYEPFYLEGLQNYFWIGVGFVLFIFPYTVTCVSTIALYVRYYRAKLADDFRVVETSAAKKEHADIIKIVLWIVFGYTVTCLPQMIYVTLSNATRERARSLSSFLHILMFMNTLVDVFVYSCLDKKFQRYVMSLLCHNKASGHQTEREGRCIVVVPRQKTLVKS